MLLQESRRVVRTSPTGEPACVERGAEQRKPEPLWAGPRPHPAGNWAPVARKTNPRSLLSGEQKNLRSSDALSLTVPNESEADRFFAALADGGQVQMPLARTFFSARFGMVADRFGVWWMVYVAP
jgi:hypothetical protein